MAEDAEQVAATYFSARKAKDFETLRSVLAEDVTFDGPLGHVDGPDAYRQSMERLSQITTDIEVQKRFVDGPDVLTWFDLHTSVAAVRDRELESCREPEDQMGPCNVRSASAVALTGARQRLTGVHQRLLGLSSKRCN